LERRQVLSAANLLITEFLASNATGLDDGDGQTSDWIEVHNADNSPVDLSDYYLTDSADDLTKWSFGERTLGPGAYLVVFASAPTDDSGVLLNDYVDGDGYAHANFRLGADGEHLALTYLDPNTLEASVVQSFAPEFPPQRADVSYGVQQATTEYVGAGSATKYLAPESPLFDLVWATPVFNDSGWADGQLGLGYETNPTGASNELLNLAPLGDATQSSIDFSRPAFLGNDGDFGNFTHTAAGLDLPAWWQVDLGGPYALEEIVLHNRSSCCQSRLRDITVEVFDVDGSAIFVSPLLNPENNLGGGAVNNGPDDLTLNLLDFNGGAPMVGQTVRVTRTPDPDRSGSNGSGNNDEPDVLSLAEVEIYGRELASFDTAFQTDLEAELFDAAPGIYLRTAFDLSDDPDDIDELLLEVQYDDGFAAYLNGVPVASANAPAALAFNSTATGNHPDADAVEFTPFDLSDHLDALVAGTNVLAIQSLNQATSSDMLLEPKLVASELSTGGSFGYMVTPTPGAVNIVNGPLITSLTENPPPPSANEDLVIAATVGDNAGNGIARVDLHYRVGFAGEVTVQVFDNGLGADAIAGDG
ncbi:MAG: lamin tail domain-containing protein, partial [Planctomycetota bacterium]